jgi:4-aminobutyrate aminotransferase-like enzyme
LVPPPGYLEGLKKLCEEHEIMFMVDEVFSGFGKTGKFLSIENWNLTPDIVCLGKSMGGGLPISAVVAKSEIIDRCNFLTHGTQGSFSGNVVSCAASIATMKVIQDEDLLGRARNLGIYIKKRLEEFYEMYPIIGDVRGLGLMIGLELVTDRKKKVPATENAEYIQQQALKNGLLISRVGHHKNVIRMTPHLDVTDKQLDLSLEILEASFKNATK